MSTHEVSPQDLQTSDKQVLNKRLETIGWALFLIMIGGIGLVPKEQVPDGVWSIGVGLIMLGLNAARYYYKIKMSTFTIGLGILALITGVADLAGVDLPVFPILLILIGANIILKPLFEKK
ncbi:MAG: hypothetical protein M1546_06925 [Chloroflexi bacterium]|nr:hypothetical protein [Chloroflexota bacterium]